MHFSTRFNLSRRRRNLSLNLRAPLNAVLSLVLDTLFPLSNSPIWSADIGIIRLPAASIPTKDFSPLPSASFTRAQPMLFVPRSSPNIFFMFQCF